TSILAEKTKDQQKISDAIEILKKYNSHEYARKQAEKLIVKAKKGLEKLPQSEAKQKLLELADFFINREF
ncbi:polyprenyl synthetase family protein, partial [Candidatus Micrarchaeota archaeon]|nr:polyprenyl synthetase family protein [Candidatus Micrarchaeota archaeon]